MRTNPRIVALEEHVSFPSFVNEVPADAQARRGYQAGSGAGAKTKELADVHDARLASMNEAGISVQVLSVVGAGADILAESDAPDFARRYNDAVAQQVRKSPDRFAAFAHLPLTAPDAAADELERAVNELQFRGALINGMTGEKFLDDVSFAPLLARAEKLDVPIYVHPGIPPESVRRVYYGGFDPAVSFLFATAGWGWHAETAVHILRMVLAGTFDRHPKLRIIIGHLGEGLPTMLARCDSVFDHVAKNLKRSVSQTILDHVSITTSGFFSEPPFVAALSTFGVDRILFSVDYPFAKNTEARAFLDALPVSDNDRIKIAHGNADRLLKLDPKRSSS